MLLIFEISGCPVVKADKLQIFSKDLVGIEHSLPLTLDIFCVYMGMFRVSCLKMSYSIWVQKDLVTKVHEYFGEHHEMPMVVTEEEAVMFTD